MSQISPEADQPMTEILTVREVAEYLRLAESTVYRLAQEGEIPGRKIGGTWRFSKDGLDRWLLERPSLKQNDRLDKSR